jgi:hypothetical protein
LPRGCPNLNDGTLIWTMRQSDPVAALARTCPSPGFGFAVEQIAA